MLGQMLVTRESWSACVSWGKGSQEGASQSTSVQQVLLPAAPTCPEFLAAHTQEGTDPVSQRNKLTTFPVELDYQEGTHAWQCSGATLDHPWRIT